MRMEQARTERLSPQAMRELLEAEAPLPSGDMRAAREARARLLNSHGWTMLELLRAEHDARNAPTPGT